MKVELRAIFLQVAATALSGVVLCGATAAQQASFAEVTTDKPAPSPMISSPTSPQPHASKRHEFWDRDNCILFGAVGTLSAADFLVTRDNLQNGGRELNPLTRAFGTSTAGLAVNFAGQTAGVIGVSYLFHKTGHHKLERIVSMLNAGGSAAAVSFDLTQR